MYREWRNPRVNEVLSERDVDIVLTILRTPHPQAWRGGKAFLREPDVSVDCAENPPWLCLVGIYSLKTAPP